MDAVRCFIGKRQHQSDLYLPQIVMALRSSVNRSTGFTPNKLMLGREVNTPADLMFPANQRDPQSTEEYVNDLAAQIKKAHEVARKTLKTSQRAMKRNYDLRVLQRTYREDDLIYMLDTATTKGRCKKLSPPWKGPGIITRVNTPSLFRVKLRNAEMTANHDRLKPCRDRVIPRWIRTFIDNPMQGEEQRVEDSKLYCICKQPCADQFMIQCDYCAEWFHRKCVDVTPSEALQIDKFKCSACSKS